MPVTYPESWSTIRAVLGHDWLTGMRGGERVLDILCEGFPDAPLLTLVHNPAAVSRTINRHRIISSWLQHIPGITRTYRRYLPLFPHAVNHIRVPQADLLISTSHCVAKSLRPPPGTRHMCYCFTPMRYAWLFYEEYFGRNPIKAILAKPMLAALRAWDRKTAARVDRFVAISRHVRDRIERFYRREADVVYPPVNTDYCRPNGKPPEGFDLVVSALVPYKRVDLAVRAYNESGRKLKIVGSGGQFEALKAMASKNVQILGWLPDDDVLDLYQRCRLLVFPGEEDFGIVPVEAQACGRPVVAYGRGGALETVKDGRTGVHFHDQSTAALNDAVQRCSGLAWDPDVIRKHAQTFGIPAFIDGLAGSIERTLALGKK
jgi:glycosyltransferase involved in cell wall biosynthesis